MTDKTVNYSKGFALPVTVGFHDGGMSVSANGETLRFHGDVFRAEGVDLKTRLTFDGGVVSARCTPERDGVLERYGYFFGKWSGQSEIVVARTSLSAICAFIRAEKTSFFFSLDFPFSYIDEGVDSAFISVDPLDKVSLGVDYLPITLSIGACALTGKKTGRYDVAEIETYSSHILSRMPEAFRGARPVFSSTCITNMMTDVRDGRVFYSLYDNPTLTTDLDGLKREVDLMAELGIEYYQVFEGYFDWEEDGSTERNLKELVDYGKKRGVRIGDYMTALELNCWHYNYHSRRVEDESMLCLNENNERNYLCYGNRNVVDMLKRTVTESVKRNGEEMICIDGNAAVKCFDGSHGHVPGSFYAHIRGLIDFMSSLNETSPYFMTWTNAGNWLEFMPKLLWYNPNVYLTDPHARSYESSPNCLKFFGDCRREQMVSVHEKYFVPYTAFTNCEYYAFRRSRVNDYRYFEYSFLQGLAVTPNICLGEIRTFLERTPYKYHDGIKSFIKKWLAFIRENISAWKNVVRIGDAPGRGAAEAYSHFDGARGFICFVNQNYYTQDHTVKLDGAIGLSGKPSDSYLISEVYPEEFLLVEQPASGLEYGKELTLTVGPESVRIIKVEPFYKSDKIRVYGAMARLIGENKFAIDAENGRKYDIAVSADGRFFSGVSVKTKANVPKYYFESSVSDVAIRGDEMRFVLHAPRDRFDREIVGWKVGDEERLYDLRYDNSDFCGAIVHNLHSERTEVFVDVSVSSSPVTYGTFSDVGKRELSPPPVKRAAKYSTTFCLPFIELPNLSGCYAYDEVLELVFADCSRVKSLSAKINGRNVEVKTYRYPSKKSFRAFYVELVGEIKSGESAVFELFVEWNDDPVREETEAAQSSDGPKIIT